MKRRHDLHHYAFDCANDRRCVEDSMRSQHSLHVHAFSCATDGRRVEGSMIVEQYTERWQVLDAAAERMWNGTSAVAVTEVQ